MRAVDAKRALRRCIDDGLVNTPWTHAFDKMRKRNLDIMDIENVLRAGIAGEAEWENGEWRYQVRTAAIVVVVQFEEDDSVTPVTAWRVKK